MFPISLFPAQVMEDRLIYENQLITTIDVQGSPRGSITRDSVYMYGKRGKNPGREPGVPLGSNEPSLLPHPWWCPHNSA